MIQPIIRKRPLSRRREKYAKSPTCLCGAEMCFRAIRGTGSFWGCSRYPECEQTRPIRWRWRNAV